MPTMKLTIGKNVLVEAQIRKRGDKWRVSTDRSMYIDEDRALAVFRVLLDELWTRPKYRRAHRDRTN